MHANIWRRFAAIVLSLSAAHAPAQTPAEAPATAPSPPAQATQAAPARQPEERVYPGLHCRVYGDSGLGVSRARIVVHELGPAGWVPVKAVNTDRSNACDITLRDGAPGTILLEVSADGYKTRRVLYVPNPNQVVPWATIVLEGDRVVEGTVVTEAGEPVRGAGVLFASPTESHETLTGLKGEFRFEDLTPGPAMLRVAVPGTGIGTYAVDLTRQPDPIEIVLKARRPARVRVLDENEQPVPGVMVAIRSPESSNTVTDADGWIEIPGVAANTGRIFLAIIDKYYYTDEPVVVVPIEPGEEAIAEAVYVVQGGRIAGRVVQPPAADGQEYGVPSAAVTMADAPNGPVATADVQGHFSFDALPAGSCLLMTAHPVYAADVAPAEVKPGRTTEVKLVMTRGARIDGVVVDEAGEPVRNAPVRVLGWWPRRILEQPGGPADPPIHLPWRGTRATAEGRFMLAGMPAGRVVLEALRPDGSDPTPVTLDIAEGQDRVEIRITLKEMAPL